MPTVPNLDTRPTQGNVVPMTKPSETDIAIALATMHQQGRLFPVAHENDEEWSLGQKHFGKMDDDDPSDEQRYHNLKHSMEHKETVSPKAKEFMKDFESDPGSMLRYNQNKKSLSPGEDI